ncbi:MAG: ABC transporter permease [Verrucomicrobia bacterium]|nr:ABC transporter permease [Verrucomicrobiota bacterium]
MKQNVHEQVTVYDSSGEDRIALSAWKHMFAEIWQFRELINRLALRNIAGQFRQSFLGYLWVALPPIATTVVFTVLRSANIFNVPMEGELLPYTLFTLIGITIWQLFTQFTMTSTTSISNAGALVSKIYFPRETLVLSATVSLLVTAAVNALIVALVFAVQRFVPAWQSVLFPLYCLPIVFLALGLSLFFAPLNTMMNDVSRILQFAFQFGMFLTPTVYRTPKYEDIATIWETILYWLHTLNPVTHVIVTVRQLTTGEVLLAGPAYWISAAVSVLVFALGWRFFHICEPLLAERI